MNRKALNAFVEKIRTANAEARLYDPETLEPVTVWCEMDAAAILDLLEGCDPDLSEIDPVSETADLVFHGLASAEIRIN